MIEKVKSLLHENSLCVLATCSEDMPHCSLMSYIGDELDERIYAVTLRNSRKYRNITRNPNVSLLIDTRTREANSAATLALTVHGICKPIENEPQKAIVIGRIQEKHPHLADILSDPDAEVLAISVQSYLLLEGPTHASYIESTKKNR